MNLGKFRRPHSIPNDLMDEILDDFGKVPMTIHEYNEIREKYVDILTTAQLAELDSSGLVKCVVIKAEDIPSQINSSI